MKAVQDWRHEALDRRLETVDVDISGLEVLQRRDVGFYARELAHHAVHLREKDFSGRGQFHALRVAIEDGRAKLVFELRDLSADSRR